MFIQGEGDDHSGTALWMGQNYGNLHWVPPEGSYTDGEWLAELCRVNRDPNTSYIFHPGDRVRVRRGPLAGVEGTVLTRRGRKRLLVSVDFLQQGASVEIEDFLLEPID